MFCSNLGRGEETLAYVAELLKPDPKFSLENLLKKLHYKSQPDFERELDTLLNAALK